MLSTAPVFPKGKSVTQVFPKGCCHHELNESTEQIVKLSSISLYVYTRQIFTNKKFVIIMLCRNVIFGSVALAFHYGRCFNASLLLYAL